MREFLDTALARTFTPRNLLNASAELYIFPIFLFRSPAPLGSPNYHAPKGHVLPIELLHSVNLVRDVGGIGQMARPIGFDLL